MDSLLPVLGVVAFVLVVAGIFWARKNKVDDKLGQLADQASAKMDPVVAKVDAAVEAAKAEVKDAVK